MTTFHCDATPVWFNEAVLRWLKEDTSHYEDEVFGEKPPTNCRPTISLPFVIGSTPKSSESILTIFVPSRWH